MLRILRSIAPFALILFLTPTVLVAQDFLWEQRADMPAGRWGASTFVIGGTAYVVAGRVDSEDRTEMWAYDLITDSWSSRAPIPVARRLAATFVINGKGYVACGLYSSSSRLDDLWEYDPVANTWAQRADFPGTARYGTYHFALNGYGYVGAGNMGSGNGPFLTDTYKYDPLSNSWSSAVALPDLARHGTSSFVLGGRAYVFGGKESDLSFAEDLWSFDPTTNSWTLLAPFPGSPRSSPLAFVYENDAVIGCGRNDAVNFYDVWRYDPPTDHWSTVPDYPGASSLAGTSFTIAGRAFGGLGWVLSDDSSAPDLWELVKPTENSIGTLVDAHGVRAFPVPATEDAINLTSPFPDQVTVLLLDAMGREISRSSFTGSSSLPIRGLAAGSYTIRWMNNDTRGSLRLLIP